MTILPICQICNKTVSEMQVERDILTRKLLARYTCHGEHETQEITESLLSGPIWPTTVFRSSSCQGSRPDTSDLPPVIPQGPFGHWHELYIHPAQGTAMAEQRPTDLYGSHASTKVDADRLANQLEIMTDRLAYVLNHCDVGLMRSKFEAELTEARTVLREYYSPNGRQELRDRISTVPKREPKPAPHSPLGPNTPASRLLLAIQEWYRARKIWLNLH